MYLNINSNGMYIEFCNRSDISEWLSCYNVVQNCQSIISCISVMVTESSSFMLCYHWPASHIGRDWSEDKLRPGYIHRTCDCCIITTSLLVKEKKIHGQEHIYSLCSRVSYILGSLSTTKWLFTWLETAWQRTTLVVLENYNKGSYWNYLSIRGSLVWVCKQTLLLWMQVI